MYHYVVLFDLIAVLSSNKRKDPFLFEETVTKRKRKFFNPNENITKEIFTVINSSESTNKETESSSPFDHVSHNFITYDEYYFEEFKPLLLEEYVYKDIYFENDFTDEIKDHVGLKTNEQKNELNLNSNGDQKQENGKFNFKNTMPILIELLEPIEDDYVSENHFISKNSYTFYFEENNNDFLNYKKFEKSLEKGDILFEINNYLNDLLIGLSKEELEKFSVELKSKTISSKFTFQQIMEIQKISIFLKENLGYNFYPCIELLETRFLVRYVYFCRFLFKIDKFHLNDIIISESHESQKEEIINFYKIYIRSLFIDNFFNNHSLHNKNYLEQSNYVIHEIIEVFNMFLNEYFSTVQSIITMWYKSYPLMVRKFFYSTNNEEIVKKLLFWIDDLFNNETNSILLLLFPEIKFFIDIIDQKIIKVIVIKEFILFSLSLF